MSSVAVDNALALGGRRALERLLEVPEDQWFERKSARIAPKDLARPLVAFANAEGGVIAIGFSDGKIEGVIPKAINDIRQAAIDHMNPPVRMRVHELEADGVTIVLLDVAPGELVHETKAGDCYVRIGDESRKVSFRERQELEYDRGSIPFDGTPAPISELDDARVEEFRQLLGSSSAELALRARNLLTIDGSPTVASYLLFSDHPQTVYPNAYVRVVKYLGDKRGEGAGQMVEAGSDVRLEGPLPDQIDAAASEIDRLMPTRRALGADGKFANVPMIPRSAWLEGLVNAVTHRSYSLAGDHIRVEIFSNRIEIASPGRFPGVINVDDPLSIHRHARNPRIARVLADLDITQELGEGIRRIVQEMRRIGLADPIYEQGPNYVRLTLMASDALPAELSKDLPRSSKIILDAMRLAGQGLGTGELEKLTGLARPTVLRHLRSLQELGVVTWQGNSVNDPRASWNLA
ncbi:MAG: helix-turn-helix domain-containing protein [Actinomycetaceae bacterium]|nr:helix-turn-helix domain-containing protein [Actinomycetaceae bacterium]